MITLSQSVVIALKDHFHSLSHHYHYQVQQQDSQPFMKHDDLSDSEFFEDM